MLLGRDRERQELDRVLATARAGHSAVMALVGEPGIGKTALLQEAANRADGLRLLRASGIDSEAEVPFAALLELLRPALVLLPRIPRPQAAALEGALALRRADPGGDRFAVGAATLSLLAAFADEQPTLLLVDDAHLLDTASGQALLFALRRLLAEPIAALIAVREGEPSLLDDADLPVLRVGGLDRVASAELLGSAGPQAVDRLYRATNGNPLALLELAADAPHLPAGPFDAPLAAPARVSRAFAQRAEGLPADTRRLLVVIAANDTGDVRTLERACALLGLDVLQVGPAETAGLVRLDDDRVEFRHPLARAAVYGEAAPDERRAAHRALASALPDRDEDRRAWHLAAAAVGTDATAASALESAARRALARRAYPAAAAAFGRAAGLTAGDQPRAVLLLHAADAAWLGGLGEHAATLLAQARELAVDHPLLVRIEHLRGRIAARRGPVRQGLAILVEAAEEAARTDRESAVEILAEAVDTAFFAGDVREMASAARRARELLPAHASTRSKFLVATADGMALVLGGEGAPGIRRIREGVALAERSGAGLRDDPALLPWLVMGALWLREAEAGRALIEDAIETARAQAAVGILPWLLSRTGRSHAAEARWGDAELEYDEGIRLARESGQAVELAANLAGLAWLEARQGRVGASREHAAEALALSRELGVGFYEIWALWAGAELALALGEAAEAAVELERLARRMSELGIEDVDISPGAELVQTYLRLGRPDDAAQAGQQLDAAAREKGQPWSLARAARCRGLLAASDAFEGHFEEALVLHGQTPDVFEAACTRLAYGARLRRERRRVRARELLRSAAETFDRLGAAPWFDAARVELAATGETARRRDASTLDDLTRQELQIARLLAGGRTTREAAAALFLSPKTIEYHLRNAYRKLGVNSRDELARLLRPDA